MRTFWTYLILFLILMLATNTLIYFTTSKPYEFNTAELIIEFIAIVLIALLASYILRKKKNIYTKKVN